MTEIIRIPLKQIEVDESQPRKTFEEIGDLIKSILKEGLLEPLKVIRKTPRSYLLLDGERRFRALEVLAKQDNEYKVANCIVMKPKTNKLITQLAFDVQKHKIPHLEEGEAYKRLLENSFTIQEISVLIGKKQTYIRDKLKLTAFNENTKELIRKKVIPAQLLYSIDIDKVKEAENIIIRRIRDEKPNRGEVRRIILEETERASKMIDLFVDDLVKLKNRISEFRLRSESIKDFKLEERIDKPLGELCSEISKFAYDIGKFTRIKEEILSVKHELEFLVTKYGKNADFQIEMVDSYAKDKQKGTEVSNG